jgi:hypothetical protein
LGKIQERDESRERTNRAPPPQLAEPAVLPHAPWALLALAVLSITWVVLAFTVFFVGPAEWDDNQYCDMAAVPRPNDWVPNRYVHIWTLRVLYLFMDSRRHAAVLCAALSVVGLMWVAYFLGRRMGSTVGGVLAAFLMPLYPVLLKYVTVPYCDEPMAFWSGMALVGAVLAGEMRSGRARGGAVAAAGLCCFLAVKCKETGVATLPAVALLLWPCAGKPRVLAQWVGGALLAWAGLIVVDGLWMHDPWFSCRLATYLPERPADPNPAVRGGLEYIEILLSRPFLTFSLLGAAGMLWSFRENRVVRAVTVWAFGALVFQSLIASQNIGIQALDRYAVGIGAPWVILAAHGLVQLWRRPATAEARRPIALVAVLLVLVGLTTWGVAHQAGGGPDNQSFAWRCYFFLFPLTVLTLLAVPWLTGARWLARAALVAVVALAAAGSMADTRVYVRQSQAKLKPWVELAAALDESDAQLVTWRLANMPFSTLRIGWRCRALSSKPPERIAEVRAVASLDEVAPNEWVVTDTKWWRGTTAELKELQTRGWRPFIEGGEGGSGFVVCRRSGP